MNWNVLKSLFELKKQKNQMDLAQRLRHALKEQRGAVGEGHFLKFFQFNEQKLAKLDMRKGDKPADRIKHSLPNGI